MCFTAGVKAQIAVQYVQPFIGTGGHGHTFPGAVVPFGMVQLSPDTRVDGSWDGCGGYHYSDSFIYGFSHTHLSGTGVSDYGDVLLMPVYGKPVFNNGQYGSAFEHSQEHASPGFYSVQLKKHQISAELTATARCGVHRYQYSKPGKASIILDLKHRDELQASEIKILSKTRIAGFRKSGGWANHEQIFFVIEFSQPFLQVKYAENHSKAGFVFLLGNKKQIEVKTAISFTGVEGALANLEAEVIGHTFDEIKMLAEQNWEKELSKIQIEGTDEEKIKFYSAFYHCMIHPSLASDADGKYMGMDMKIHQTNGWDYYSVFSLWDTYRALHPLLSITDRKRTLDFIQTFLAMYQDGGRLPVWELASNETNCMIGYHVASVITDAFLKGIRGFDSSLALKAMMDISNENYAGKTNYIRDGFISSEKEPESVSKTLEYAYDDWCISVFARAIGENEIASKYLQRSSQWRNLFDPVTGFIRPRYNGNWLEPFDPREVNNHFTEANCWQYSFYVPQDIRGLMKSFGGADGMGNKLDQLFSEKGGTTGREQSDITGLIGQYAHGNEPSHHMAYLYNYIYMPERGQNLIHYICDQLYTTKPDGLIGNEDCGQMSAWYVLSALGMYQVTPGYPVFTLGTPSVSSAEIHLENGNIFKINTRGKSANSFFSKPLLDKEVVMFISYQQMMNGSALLFDLSEIPNEKSTDYLLPELPSNSWTRPAPPLVMAARRFREKTKVEIKNCGEQAKIFYYLNTDSMNPIYYRGPFEIDATCGIHSYSVLESGIETQKSFVSFCSSYKMPNSWNIELKFNPNPQYTAGGKEALQDGIHGSTNWRAGDWQGYQNSNFEALVDLGNMTQVNEVSAEFLQDTRAWILMPKKIEVFISTDGVNFIPAGNVLNTLPDKDYNVQVKKLTVKINNPKKCRYVKLVAQNYGALPEWHAGYPFDGKAFIFIDEIEIK